MSDLRKWAEVHYDAMNEYNRLMKEKISAEKAFEDSPNVENFQIVCQKFFEMMSAGDVMENAYEQYVECENKERKC